MYEAGAAAVILGGRLDPKGFLDWGRKVAEAKAEKEHQFVLGAKDEASGPLQRFIDKVIGARNATLELQGSVDKSMVGVSASVDRGAVSAGRGFEVIQVGAKKASESVLLMGDSFKTMNKVVGDETAHAAAKVQRLAREDTLAKDRIVRNDEEIIASKKQLEKNYANPLGPPGGGGRGGGGRGGGASGAAGAGAESEKQAKKTTDAWKAGFATLAGVGKWATVGILGVGAVSVKFAADFQRQMELIHTQVGYTEKDVQTLRKNVLDLAPAVGVGPTELAKGLYHVTSVLQGKGGTNEAMMILKLAAEGAKVGMANMEDVSSALMAVYESAPKDIHSVSEAMGVMNDIVGQGNLRMEDLSKALSTGLLAAAKNAHLGLRDVGAALDTMTSRGIPAEQAATRLRTTLTLMAAPTGKAQKALAELGMSHDRLANDMQRHGLSYALADLQKHLDATFPPGRKLTLDQERKALMDYGSQLQAAGVHGKTLAQDLINFKKQLDTTGSSAVAQSQLITSAFGGSRMGTTMALLMQNADDVRKRFDNLNKANAAGRFQKDWQATQKDFSVQAAQLWAGVQKLGIQLGDWLIPKVKALVLALIDAGKWLGHHKVLAEALAVVFGTVLVAAIAAFFASLTKKIAGGIADIARFSKAVATLGRSTGESTSIAGRFFDRLKAKIMGVRTAAEELNGTNVNVTETDQGAGTSSPGGSMLGAIEGMITGVRGTTAPGSAENPLAVVVMATESFGLASRGAASEAKTLTSAEARAAQVEGMSPGGVYLPPGVKSEATAAESAAAAEAGAIAPIAGEAPGLLSKAGGLIKGVGRFAGGAMIPTMIGGTVGSMAQGALGLRGGGTATAVGGVVGGALGMLAGPIGAGIGSALGSALGPTVAHVLGGVFGSGPSAGQRAAAAATRGVTGMITAPTTGQQRSVADVQAAIARNVDEAQHILSPTVNMGIRLQPPTRQQLDAARNSLEQAGKLAGQSFVAGYQQHVRDVSGASLVSSFESKMKDLPKSMGSIAKNAAASQMLEYAASLEANKQLPKGQTQKIIKELEAYYPGLNKYLQSQGESTDAELANVFKLKQSRSVLAATIKWMGNQFDYVPKDSKVNLDNMTQQFGGAMKYLQDVIKTSTGKQRDDALAAYKQLVTQYSTYLGQMETRTKSHMTNIQKELAGGSQNAVNKVLPYWNQYVSIIQGAEQAGVITVQQGNKLIASDLDKALQALGLSSHQAKNLAKAGYSVSDVTNQLHGARGASLSAVSRAAGTGSAAPGHASGGFLPGSEYGHEDKMTLVDPQGRPRARMAGNEAIFNDKQMPFVEAGLQAIGFHSAEDLWNRVSMPHGGGFAGGGRLPRLFGGGQLRGGTVTPYSQYALPLPSQYMSLPWSPDQGIDIAAPAHTPEYAIGDGVIVQEGISGFGPWAPILKVLVGPLTGTEFYYGHAGPNFAHKGQHVKAGQAITQVGAGIVGMSTGPHIEFGFWPPRGGAAVARFLKALEGGANVAQFGGGALGGAWTDIKSPKVHGNGVIPSMAQAVLNQVTKGANQYGQSQVGASGFLSGFHGGGNDTQNEALARRMMLASGWGPDQWPYLQKLWTQESHFGTHATNPSSGAYGIPQSLPASKMQAAGKDWRTNPATQIAWGLNYIRGTYHSPQAAWQHEVANNWYAGGGQLPGFYSGGRNPWGTLPAHRKTLPGHRGTVVRRSASGLRTAGGRSSTGRSRGTGSKRSGRAGSVKRAGRTKQPLSQSVANVLDSLGLGTFTADQNELGKLDQEYTTQESLFNMFDAASGGLPQEDLNVLMGIREQEWDILYGEWKALPGAIDTLQSRVDEIEGHPATPAHWRRRKGSHRHPTKAHPHAGMVHVKAQPSTGQALTTTDISSVEATITNLQHEVTQTSRAITTERHLTTGRAMQVADHYASVLAGYTDQLSAIADRRSGIAQQRIGLRKQSESIASTGSSGPESLSSLVGQVMSGITQAPSAASGASAQKKRIQRQITNLAGVDNTLSTQSRHIHDEMRKATQSKNAEARALRQEGFDAAWGLTLRKWKLQDRITSLKAKLAKLKKLLTEENTQISSEKNALQTLQDWQSGGLQGNEAIVNSLGDMGMNILGLYQEGADLPTPGRSSPTLKMIEDILSAAPPNGLGLTLPPGLTQGTATAAAETAAQDWANFMAARQALFAQFGSNFVAAGANPFAGTAGAAAGVQYYGAAAGASAGPGTLAVPPPAAATGGYIGRGQHGHPSPGSTTIKIEQNFAAGPPDPHTWSAGVAHELQAAA